MKFVAVTACPTGVAHTYMAAEQLSNAAKDIGLDIKVETQGAMGIENELTAADIAAAAIVILAVDIVVEKANRFDHIPKIEVSVQEAIKNPLGVLGRAVNHLSGNDT